MNFIQQAYKGNNEWWTYLISLLLLFFGWQVIGVIPLVWVAFDKAGSLEVFMEAANSNFTSLGINSSVYLLLVIATFLGGLLAILGAVKIIHKRSIISLFTARDSIDWGRVFNSFAVWFLVGVVMIAIDYLIYPNDYQWNFEPQRFAILVVVAFLFLPIQTSMEELLFRGYLMQGFGTWFKKPVIALLFTSIIFGLLHGLNPEVEKLGYITMVYYIGTGLLMGLLTLIDDGTELALGFHAANNIVAAVFVTANWTVFQTDALLIDISEPSVSWEMFVPVFILYPLLLVYFSKKYDWSDWKAKLFSKINKPIELDEDKFLA